jgi:hypothetical protein
VNKMAGIRRRNRCFLKVPPATESGLNTRRRGRFLVGPMTALGSGWKDSSRAWGGGGGVAHKTASKSGTTTVAKKPPMSILVS